jgi:ectoine hydroxylase-related dioxygenase (phytanoyl-CoA dioxygenase family)
VKTESKLWRVLICHPYFKEVHLKAGDAILFTDALIHGASVRTNEGERRALIYRYSSFWTRDRFGYEYSDELVARLTPARRKIIRPIEPSKPPVAQRKSV